MFNVYFCQASGSSDRDVKHKRSYSESRHLSQNKSQNMASSQSVDFVDGLGVEENAVSAQEIKKSMQQVHHEHESGKSESQAHTTHT